MALAWAATYAISHAGGALVRGGYACANVATEHEVRQIIGALRERYPAPAYVMNYRIFQTESDPNAAPFDPEDDVEDDDFDSDLYWRIP